MASEGADPAAPQSQVVKVSTTNNPAMVGAYTDASLTKRNISQAANNAPLPAKSGSKVRSTRSVYATDQLEEIQQTASNPSAHAPAHASNIWQLGHDLYANGGNVTGQSYTGTNENDTTPLAPSQVYPSS